MNAVCRSPYLITRDIRALVNRADLTREAYHNGEEVFVGCYQLDDLPYGEDETQKATLIGGYTDYGVMQIDDIVAMYGLPAVREWEEGAFKWWK